ncbi:MAG: RNA 2',3'-cyclic phosphodiesterase [Acidobacteriia bacterium]|jgi:2'-5' RNA ligase|nr:RNA 2',3'-cyclic phosphodiesterase [Terriglobia bacterium]
MRVFVGLDIDNAVRARLEQFLDGVRGFAPEARWVRPESMHVTLKFIGEKSSDAVEEIKQALGAIRAGGIEISFRGHGFFPTAKAPRVFWVGIAAGPQLAALAKSVDDVTAGLGIPKEEHEFSPHLTLASRRGSGAPHWRKDDGPNLVFERLQEKLAAMRAIEFGTMTAREFFLYQSQPMQGGSRYTKIARVELG